MISPSLLSADFTNLEKEIKILNEEKVDFLHLDIMDGNYVPNISYGPGIVKSLRELTEIPFDTHLMIERPEDFIEKFVEAGSDIITIHPSTTKHLDRTLSLIKSYGKKAGLALNPGDSLDVLDYNLEKLDLVLIMSVNPGFGGQKFIPSALKKIKEVKKLIQERNLSTLIEVDGGVKLNNAKDILEAGADILVSGSGIFEKGKTRENIKAFKEILWKKHF